MIRQQAQFESGRDGTVTLVVANKPIRLQGSGSTELWIALIILGVIVLSTMRAQVPWSVMLFGWLIVGSGIVEAVQAFRTRRTDGFFQNGGK